MRSIRWWHTGSWLALVALFGLTTGSAGERAVALRFIEISPERLLPVVSDASRAIGALESGEGSVFPPHAPLVEANGWKTVIRPHPGMDSFDDYLVSMLTNDPDRAKAEARALFEAIGFIPVDEFSEGFQRGEVSVSVIFFGDLVFLYGPPPPIIVMERTSREGSYRYKSSSPATLGRVSQATLGGVPVYFFDEDHGRTLASARREYPTSQWLVVWDHLGREAFRARYDELAWTNDRLNVVRNTIALATPCGRDSSSYNCHTSGSACQVSLLGPVTGEPVVLRTIIGLAYDGGELGTRGMSIQLLPAKEFAGRAVSCMRFYSTAEILRESDFGVCGVNIDGDPRYRCLGTAEGYLHESQEASVRYWFTLKKEIDSLGVDEMIDINRELSTALQALLLIEQPDMTRFDPPRGLGYRDAFGLTPLLEEE